MTIQSRKRIAGYALVMSVLLFLYSLPFENDSSFIKLTFLVSKSSSPSVDYPSFIASQVSNDRNDVATNSTTRSSCLVTSQVQVFPHQERHWILSSFDSHGRPKSKGGDEYYVTYTDNSMIFSKSPTAVAMVDDLENGSYKLHFVTSPSLSSTRSSLIATLCGRGTISIILQYSCGVGHLAPPSKQHWRTGGAMNALYTLTNRTAPTTMHSFVTPNTGVVDFGKYNRVVAYGDSTMGQFAQGNLIWPGGNVGAPLTTDTVHYPRERKTVVSPSFITQITNQVQNAREEYGDNIALVMGSGVWDILADDSSGHQGTEFWNHRQALRQLITAIRTTFPTLDLYWKSVTAMHIHNVENLDTERVFYMSSSRAYDLYRYQREIINEMNVSFLDLYPATLFSAEHLLTLDGRHYSPEFNLKMLNWFYRASD